MSSEIAIKVDGLGKCYQIYEQPRDRLKQFLMPRLLGIAGMTPRQYFREFWALHDVSFEVMKGETVGIIGRNGSGKSTLLQLICGTLSPTCGTVRTSGRIAALLELGSGFNPEFTGRENVYMSGAILGLSSQEIDSRFDDIAAFADIGDFIEQPVKTYSSGMFVRLAFAVNIMSAPDIMIVDEALAVGDMVFQAKCMTALTRIQERGTTVLFVSHDVGSVKSLCSRGICLDRGRLTTIGKAAEVAELYIRTMREEMNAEQRQFSPAPAGPQAARPEIEQPGPPAETAFRQSSEFDARVAQLRYGSGGARIACVELLDMDDRPVVSAQFDQRVQVRIHFSVDAGGTIAPAYYVLDDKRNLILGAGPRQVGHALLECKAGGRYIVTYTTSLPLQDGNYSIQAQLNRPIIPDQAAEFLDVVDDAVVFSVQRRENGRVWTKVLLPNGFQAVEA